MSQVDLWPHHATYAEARTKKLTQVGDSDRRAAPFRVTVAVQVVAADGRSIFYCTALIMSKIGRYMATTMPPTTTPRNTIMIGSSSESRLLTAASTSSS